MASVLLYVRDDVERRLVVLEEWPQNDTATDRYAQLVYLYGRNPERYEVSEVPITKSVLELFEQEPRLRAGLLSRRQARELVGVSMWSNGQEEPGLDALANALPPKMSHSINGDPYIDWLEFIDSVNQAGRVDRT